MENMLLWKTSVGYFPSCLIFSAKMMLKCLISFNQLPPSSTILSTTDGNVPEWVTDSSFPEMKLCGFSADTLHSGFSSATHRNIQHLDLAGSWEHESKQSNHSLLSSSYYRQWTRHRYRSLLPLYYRQWTHSCCFLGCIYTAGLDAQFRFIAYIRFSFPFTWVAYHLVTATSVQYLHLH